MTWVVDLLVLTMGKEYAYIMHNILEPVKIMLVSLNPKMVLDVIATCLRQLHTGMPSKAILLQQFLSQHSTEWSYSNSMFTSRLVREATEASRAYDKEILDNLAAAAAVTVAAPKPLPIYPPRQPGAGRGRGGRGRGGRSGIGLTHPIKNANKPSLYAITEGFCRSAINGIPCSKELASVGSCIFTHWKSKETVLLKHASEWNLLAEQKKSEIRAALSNYNSQVAIAKSK